MHLRRQEDPPFALCPLDASKRAFLGALFVFGILISLERVFSRFGGDLLSHVLRRSTIGASALNGRVRNGIACFARAMTTKPRKNPVCFMQTTHHVQAKDVFLWRMLLSCRDIGLSTTGSNQAYRAISTGQLNVSPRLHLRPIDEVVYLGPQGYLVLRGASRLDAFSGYPVRS